MTVVEETLVAGCQRIVVDLHGDCHIHNSVTGQVRKLGSSDNGVWKLDADERGVDFVYQDEAEGETWVPGIMTFRVYEGAGVRRIEDARLENTI